MSLTPRLDKLEINLLINGNFDFWQRGTSFTAGDNYTADRWKTQTAGASVDQVSLLGVVDGAKYGIRYTATAQEILLEQRLESNFVRHLEGEEVTLSFKSRATSGTPTLQLDVLYADTENDWASSTSVISNQNLGTLDGTMTTYSHTFTVTSDMAQNGFNIVIKGGTTTATVDFSQIMLNTGSQVNDYSLAGRNYQEELQLCQRYFEKSYNLDVDPGTITDSGSLLTVSPGTGVGTAAATISYTPKRAIPTFILYNPNTGAVGSWDRNGVAVAANIYDSGTSSLSIENTAGTSDSSRHLIHWISDAEL